VIERKDGISFTHRIEEKASSRSYGIEVAHLAGLPEVLISRARELMLYTHSNVSHFDNKEMPLSYDNSKQQNAASTMQTQKYMALSNALSEINPNNMTPLEALMFLTRLKELQNQ